MKKGSLSELIKGIAVVAFIALIAMMVISKPKIYDSAFGLVLIILGMLLGRKALHGFGIKSSSYYKGLRVIPAKLGKSTTLFRRLLLWFTTISVLLLGFKYLIY